MTMTYDCAKIESNWLNQTVSYPGHKKREEIKIKNKENSDEINRWSVDNRPPN